MNTPSKIVLVLRALNLKESFIQGKNEENVINSGRVVTSKKENFEMVTVDGDILYISVSGECIDIRDAEINKEWVSFFKN